jgi:hypothetical protein
MSIMLTAASVTITTQLGPARRSSVDTMGWPESARPAAGASALSRDPRPVRSEEDLEWFEAAIVHPGQYAHILATVEKASRNARGDFRIPSM